MSNLYIGRALIIGCFHTLAVITLNIVLRSHISEFLLSILPISLMKIDFEGGELFYPIGGLITFGLIEVLVTTITISTFLFNVRSRIAMNCLILALSILLFRFIAGDLTHSWYSFGLASSMLSCVAIILIGTIKHRKYNNRLKVMDGAERRPLA
ncbi:hypothetical protein [Agarivorans sp. JK6]|uniref:hypothetical protein n=1 Tax=Agarivorans sp. JK6 TaxID=2997426 RepID=UPI00387357A4